MFEITVGYHGARKKGREKVEGKRKKKRKGEMVDNETKGSRAPRRFDSRRKGRFRVYAAVCVPRAGSACCIPKGAISNFTELFISLARALPCPPFFRPIRS